MQPGRHALPIEAASPRLAAQMNRQATGLSN
jgi:hypothetical protein